MRPRKRDSSFLAMAAIAATGGALAIVLSIGFPIWARHHGWDVTPAFSLFAGWGVAALGGAYACLKTYLISDDTDKPPRGGARLALVKNFNALPTQRTPESAPQERAA